MQFQLIVPTDVAAKIEVPAKRVVCPHRNECPVLGKSGSVKGRNYAQLLAICVIQASENLGVTSGKPAVSDIFNPPVPAQHGSLCNTVKLSMRRAVASEDRHAVLNTLNEAGKDTHVCGGRDFAISLPACDPYLDLLKYERTCGDNALAEFGVTLAADRRQRHHATVRCLAKSRGGVEEEALHRTPRSICRSKTLPYDCLMGSHVKVEGLGIKRLF